MVNIVKHVVAPGVAACAVAYLIACGGDGGTPVEPDPIPPISVGDIETWAGTGVPGFDGDGGTRDKCAFYLPIDVEFTPTFGAIFIDFQNHALRRELPDGKVRTIMGGELGDGPLSPNTGADISGWWPASQSALNHPTRVQEFGYNGRPHLLVTCWHNHKMRVLDVDNGLQTVLFGRGPGCKGDGEPVDSLRMNQNSHCIEGPDGKLYILDQRNQCIRRADLAGEVSETIVGQLPTVCNPLVSGDFGGDGGDPKLAKLNFPSGPNPPTGGGLCFDAQGRLYIADTLNHRIRRVDFGLNVINTVVGFGTPGYSGDGNGPLAAELNEPHDIEFGPDGRLYIADTYNHAVRAVDFTANTIVTVAGTGTHGFSGDRGPAVDARLTLPWGIAFTPGGDLIIADTYNNRYRRVRLQ